MRCSVDCVRNQTYSNLKISFLAALSSGGAYAYRPALIDYRLHGNNSAGLQKTSTKVNVKWKKPKRKPRMVQFLEEVETVAGSPWMWFYKLLYYLRIPYFVYIIKRRKLKG